MNQSKNVAGENLFVVVKHAGLNWQYYWEQDPKETGVIDIHNASFTPTGKLLNAPNGGLVKA